MKVKLSEASLKSLKRKGRLRLAVRATVAGASTASTATITVRAAARKKAGKRR